MDRKKLGALLVAFATGILLSAGSALAAVEEVRGYILGDPAQGKLVPYFRIGATTATLIGIESELHEPASLDSTGAPITVIHGDVSVHVFIFDKRSNELINFSLCLSPWDFGFVVLQSGGPTPGQREELSGDPSDPAFSRGIGGLGFGKAKIISLAELNGISEGYVTLAENQEYFSVDGSCSGTALPFSFDPIDVHIATWAVLADVGTGFFATEIPTPTAVVDPGSGIVSGLLRDPGTGEVLAASLGLIPGPTPDVANGCGGSPGRPLGLPGVAECGDTGTFNIPWFGNQVLARYDINPFLDAHTELFVWLKRNAFPVESEADLNTASRAGAVPGIFYCEDETPLSVRVLLPNEVNVIDIGATYGQLGECVAQHQYRGILTFHMPDTGFLWSHITQNSAHFRQNYIGYNLDNNGFVDCADDRNDFDESSNGLCGPLADGVL